MQAAQRGDRAEALRLLRLAADAGVGEADYNLGSLYEFGDGVPRDHAEAVRRWKEAARLFQARGDQGDVSALNHLGGLYADGKGVGQDYVEAAHLYKLAADQGDADGQAHLGGLTEFGWGVAQDTGEAVRLMGLAADQGHVGALVRLGILYEGGGVVAADFPRAALYLKAAADQGDREAQYALASLYAVGMGVPRDETTAQNLMSKAAAQGFGLAKDWLTSHSNPAAQVSSPAGGPTPSPRPPAGGLTASSLRPSIISNPDWVRVPNGDDLASFYPAAAKNNLIEGRSRMQCVVTALGETSNCMILSEAPIGYGFGAASLHLTPSFKMRPRTIDGAPVSGGTVIIPIRWRAAQPLPVGAPDDAKAAASSASH